MRRTLHTMGDRIACFFYRVWMFLRKQVQNAKMALVAISLFIAVVFTFVFKTDHRQALGTVVMADGVADEDAEDGEMVAAAPAEQYAVGEKLEKMAPLPPEQVDEETLWLARGIYSETKEPQEQELVAWTLRNRVETGYRGNSSYQEAVLDPYQYSAFIEGTPTREHYANLPADSDEPGFRNAVAIAKQVKEAPAELRPFEPTTRHFYSEQSMAGGRAPDWAVGESPITPKRPIKLDAKRFRFYKDIA